MAEARLRARADLDSSGFDRGITKMRQSVTSFSSGQLRSLAGIAAGAFTVGRMQAWASEAINAADRISEVGIATKMTAEQIQTLTFLTTQYGGSVDKLFTGIERLRKVQSDPIAGGKIATKIGMPAEQFRTAPTAQVLESLAKYYAATGDAKTATDALGRGSMELTGVMNQLAVDGFAGSTKAAKEFGAVMRDETINSLDELKDRMDGFAMQRQRVFGTATIGIVNFAKNIGTAWNEAVNESSMLERLTIFNPVVKFVARLSGQGNISDTEARGNYLEKQRQAAVMARKQDAATMGQIEEEKSALEAKKAKAFADIVSDMQSKSGVLKIEAADTFAKVGAFTGAQISPETSIAKQQLEIQRRQEQWMEKHAKGQAENNDILSDIRTNTSE